MPAEPLKRAGSIFLLKIRRSGGLLGVYMDERSPVSGCTLRRNEVDTPRTDSPASETIYNRKESMMATSVYKVIELVGSSSESWEKAAKAAVETASKNLRDLRVAEVVQLDMHLEDGKVKAYRAKVKVSFKYHSDD